MKYFKDLPKLMVVTPNPVRNKRLIEAKTRFNSFPIKALNKEITPEATEEIVLQLKGIIASYADVLNTEEGKETLDGMMHTLDILEKLDATFHMEVMETREEKNMPKLPDGTIDIISLRGFPEYDIKIFALWCKRTALEGFEKWFDSVKRMVKILKHNYAANDMRLTDTTDWKNDLWLLHTSLLKVCDLDEETLREWAECCWEVLPQKEETTVSRLQIVFSGFVEEMDKEFVISRTSHDAISLKEQFKEDGTEEEIRANETEGVFNKYAE